MYTHIRLYYHMKRCIVAMGWVGLGFENLWWVGFQKVNPCPPLHTMSISNGLTGTEPIAGSTQTKSTGRMRFDFLPLTGLNITSSDCIDTVCQIADVV